MKRMLLIAACAAVLLFLLTLSHWRNTAAVADMFAMDTVIEFHITGRRAEAALADAQREVARLDRELDADGSGALAAFNRDEAPSEEFLSLFERCREIEKQTAGSLDIALYDLIRLWGFTTEDYKVPSEEEIRVALKEERVDLGAVAKGYGADHVRGILENYAVERAVVSLGGTVLVYGNREAKVAIADVGTMAYAGVICASDCVISTSGAYERYFEAGGVRYGHILDPATGYPAASGLLSATVVAKEGVLSDALSTALFVMGEEKAKALWEQGGFECVLITDDGRIIVSEGLSGKFTLENTDYQKEVWDRG